MKKLFILLLSALSLTAVAQEYKKVAILPTVDVEGNVKYGIKFQLRASLTYAINQTPGYKGFDRVDISSIMSEQDFQRTGNVSNDQIKRLGIMTGAQYVLIAEAALYDDQNIIIAAKILDVETGGLIQSSPPSIASKDPEKMQEACVKVAQKLLGLSGSGSSGGGSRTPGYGTPGYASSSPSRGQDFTETAWGVNMKMIWVEGGEFMMGCTSEQGGGCGDDEKNVRRVTVDGFYIGMLEVTQAQWELVMGTNPSYSKGTDLPVEWVSWAEAMEFCNRLSQKTGKTYTLPTEAQWEYAARGGNRADGTKYAGSNMVDAVAWYKDNSGGKTHPCGTKRANALGIYDMSGNVCEWCKDWYSSSYTSYDTNNPNGPSSGSYRVYRGGSWYGSAWYCSVACRAYNWPSTRHISFGFRVVLLP